MERNFNKDEDCLAYNPFSCDRESDITLLSDKFVITRKEHNCNICQQKFPSKSRARARTEIDNDAHVCMTFYFCPECCYAMAFSWYDDGKQIEERTNLGIWRSCCLE